MVGEFFIVYVRLNNGIMAVKITLANTSVKGCSKESVLWSAHIRQETNPTAAKAVCTSKANQLLVIKLRQTDSAQAVPKI